MKNILFLLGLLIALLLNACSFSTKKEIKFPVVEQVSFETVDSLFLGQPLTMQIFDNIDLYISDFHEPMIIHYDLDEKKEVSRFLNKGNGPEETLPPVILSNNSLFNNRLYTLSKQSRNLGYYTLIENPISYTPLFRFPYFFGNIISFDKDRYLVHGFFEDDSHYYRILDEQGNEIQRIGEYPDFLQGEKDFPNMVKVIFHTVQFSCSNYRKKIVSTGPYVLDIIDFSQEITDSSIQRIPLAKYDYTYTTGTHNSTEIKSGFVYGSYDLASDDSYIYLLFNPNTDKNEGLKAEIWVFDWDGNPVKKLLLNRSPSLITISGDSHIYGLVLNKDEMYEIVKVKI
ncbi:hypothetical protein FACS189432_00300 [Bacteroidia bacterium]|nr:hypothetical protein FACS189426_01840 [Bacteroidia bacterium]GHT26256.1 hypothetical protein FACS189432_00300 [Bacteroidia bacterium]